MPFFRLSTYKADKNHRSIINQKWIGRVILDFSNEHTSGFHPCDHVQSIRTSHHLHTLKRFLALFPENFHYFFDFLSFFV